MPRSLLIVDDSKSVRDAVQKALIDTGLFSDLFYAENGIKALDILLKNQVDFIITDVIMPMVDGFKLVSTIKNQEKYRNVPVIMLTGQKDSIDKIKGLELGASDYVTKPFDPGELIARVKVLIRMQELQEELTQKNLFLKSLNQKLEKIAITDELTGMFNRRYFFSRFVAEFERCKRFSQSLACVMIDIDHFKKINDTYGHLYGDEALRNTALGIRGCTRIIDIAARYGGEEFAVILPTTDKEGALIIGNRIRDEIDKMAFPVKGLGKIARFTVSLGIASYPKDASTIEELINNADRALYKAKGLGKNRVVLFGNH